MEKLKQIWEVFLHTLTKEYICFEGRVDRERFWFFMAIPLLASVILSSCGKVGSIINAIIWLGLLLPTLGMWVRRFHDIGKKWTSLLIALIPLVGQIIVIVWACRPGQLEDNEFGPNPLAKAAEAPVVEAAPEAKPVEAPKAEAPKAAPKAKAPKKAPKKAE